MGDEKNMVVEFGDFTIESYSVEEYPFGLSDELKQKRNLERAERLAKITDLIQKEYDDLNEEFADNLDHFESVDGDDHYCFTSYGERAYEAIKEFDCILEDISDFAHDVKRAAESGMSILDLTASKGV